MLKMAIGNSIKFQLLLYNIPKRIRQVMAQPKKTRERFSKSEFSNKLRKENLKYDKKTIFGPASFDNPSARTSLQSDFAYTSDDGSFSTRYNDDDDEALRHVRPPLYYKS